jgi:FMN reductase
VELGPQLLAPGSAAVERLVQQLRESAVLVVASPTYKGTYTGLLKLLFDQIPAGQLCGALGVPLMVGGSAAHALAVDVHLRPLLLEVGCSCPTGGLFIVESELEAPDATLSAWLERWGGVLDACAR